MTQADPIHDEPRPQGQNPPGPVERICFLADARSPLVHRWLCDAASRDREVHLISIDPLQVPLPKVTVHCVVPRALLSLPRAMRYVIALWPVRRLLRRLHPDIVHAHYAWGYGILGTFTTHAPLIVSVWGSDLLLSARTSPWHTLIMKRVLRRADRICATSRHLAAVAAEYTDKEILLTPFGVDTDRFRPAWDGTTPSSSFTIGMVKNLHENSGVATLLRAVALLDSSLRERVQLRLVGRLMQNGLPELTASLGISERTTFDGAVDAEWIPAMMRTLDLFVQPSLHTEGFGVAVLEAEATGIPVIASSVGGLHEVVVDGTTGILVPPGDPVALSRAITQLLEDHTLREQMGRAARQFVLHNYASAHTADQMNAVHSDLIQAGRHQ